MGSRVVEIGDADGRIAFYMNKRTATDLAHLYGPRDRAFDEILEAVEKAYPTPAAAGLVDQRSGQA